ncbi:hypothetical protein HanHA300_Chr05g0167621 [Helianthus annuus]|nr:hypothetical protein HanHA300_Chr05g0167621 [Helianthus annuus]KAJ0583875.1 hypothetical protein HanHA89_Chr05g0181701 [Helianthus annuus]
MNETPAREVKVSWERVADLLPFDQLIEYESMISSYMRCLIKQLSLLLWA